MFTFELPFFYPLFDLWVQLIFLFRVSEQPCEGNVSRYNSWHFKSDGRVYKYFFSVLKFFYELQEPEGNIPIEWRVAASKRP